MRAAAPRRPTRRPDSRCAARYASPVQELVDLIARHGVALVFLNVLLEQLGLPVPAVPTLIVAGALAATGQISAAAVRMGWPTFIVLNGIGIALWSALPIGVGMLFADQVDRAIAWLEGYGVMAVALVGAALAAYIAFKWWERRRFFRALRLARITVEELRSLMDRDKRPVVVDVRSEVARKADARFIPGALVIGVGDVEARLHDLPRDRDIVFYCSCPNEASAALVAKKLIQLGYKRVRPLAGGLDAWLAAGHDVELRPPGHSGVT